MVYYTDGIEEYWARVWIAGKAGLDDIIFTGPPNASGDNEYAPDESGSFYIAFEELGNWSLDYSFVKVYRNGELLEGINYLANLPSSGDYQIFYEEFISGELVIKVVNLYVAIQSPDSVNIFTDPSNVEQAPYPDGRFYIDFAEIGGWTLDYLFVKVYRERETLDIYFLSDITVSGEYRIFFVRDNIKYWTWLYVAEPVSQGTTIITIDGVPRPTNPNSDLYISTGNFSSWDWNTGYEQITVMAPDKTYRTGGLSGGNGEADNENIVYYKSDILATVHKVRIYVVEIDVDDNFEHDIVEPVLNTDYMTPDTIPNHAEDTVLTIVLYDQNFNEIPYYPFYLQATHEIDSGGHDHDGPDNNRPEGCFNSDRTQQSVYVITDSDGNVMMVENGLSDIPYQTAGYGGVDRVELRDTNNISNLNTSPYIIEDEGQKCDIQVRFRYDSNNDGTPDSDLVRFTEDGSDFSDYFELTGATDDHTAANNHYGIPGLIDALEGISRTFYNRYSLNSANDYILAYNDMSLPFGGLFDINGNWRNPHQTHREGRNCDIEDDLFIGGNEVEDAFHDIETYPELDGAWEELGRIIRIQFHLATEIHGNPAIGDSSSTLHYHVYYPF
jgi:hypothetical protein